MKNRNVIASDRRERGNLGFVSRLGLVGWLVSYLVSWLKKMQERKKVGAYCIRPFSEL